jgi:hypothetical protein
MKGKPGVWSCNYNVFSEVFKRIYSALKSSKKWCIKCIYGLSYELVLSVLMHQTQGTWED